MMIEDFTGFVIYGQPVDLESAGVYALMALAALIWTIRQEIKLRRYEKAHAFLAQNTLDQKKLDQFEGNILKKKAAYLFKKQ